MKRNRGIRRIVRRWFGVLALVLSLAMVTGLVTAVVPAPVARADTPVTATNPGGDFTITMEDGGVPTATMNQWISTTLPEALGLSANPTLSTLTTALYQDAVGAGSTSGPPPTSVTGTITTTANSVSIDVPASSVPPTDSSSGPNQPLSGFMSGLIGSLSAIVFGGGCAYLGGIRNNAGELSKSQMVSCAALGVIMSSLASVVLGDYFSGATMNGDEFKKALVFTVTSAVLLAPFLSPWLQEVITERGSQFGTWFGNMVATKAAWLGAKWNWITNAIMAAVWKQPTTGNTLPIALGAAGLATPVAAGAIEDRSIAGVPDQCVDAYGAQQYTYEGEAAAINACNGSQAQQWTEWTNGRGSMLSNGGMCLDITGQSHKAGAKLELWECNGQWNQSWWQAYSLFGTAEMQNPTDGGCVDDPQWDTTPGTQLQQDWCRFTTAQRWLMPGNTSGTGGDPTVTDQPSVTGDGAVDSGFSAECMDAYGSSDGASAGQVVAINACNGNEAQEWTTWSDGTVRAWNLCLDTTGGTQPLTGTPLVDLEPCDGALSQVWTAQSDGALVNSASGTCLDDPFGNTSAGVQLDVYPCNGSQAQRWALPAAPPGATPPPTAATGTSVCDIYASGGTPCAAAYSMDRALYSAYDGPLYQVQRASDGQTASIGLLAAGGDVDASGQDSFCAPPVMAGTEPVSIVHCGYTSVFTVDAASGDLQETYLPAIGGPWYSQDLSENYSTPPTDTTPTAVVHDAGATGSAASCGYTSVYTVDRNGDLEETYLPVIGGPWYHQDLSGSGNLLPATPPVLPGTAPVAIVHCGYTSVFTVDANGDQLQETYLPAIGGAWHTQDLSSTGGTMPGAPPTVTTPTAVVHSAGAGAGSNGCDGYTSVFSVDRGSQHLQETFLPNQGFPGDAWHTQDLSSTAATMPDTPPVAPGTAPVALVHMGYTSVYTVDEGSDQLEESYLPAIGDSWSKQSLSANYYTPQTDQTPIVLLHPDTSGVMDWASVFTVDEFDSHLEETYLSNEGFPGDAWVYQDLSDTGNLRPGTPPVYQLQSSPASWSVAHTGYTSTYTVAANGDLWESYLPSMGGSWQKQDLSDTGGTLPGTPPVLAGTTPVAVVHDGYTSVYTVARNGELWETYLPAIGDSWSAQNLSAEYGTPESRVTPTVLFHDGYVSVYTVDDDTGDLWETYLPAAGFPGDAWQKQDLSDTGGSLPGTPPVRIGTSPVAIGHDGYVSVYTVDQNGDLQETFLPYMGDSWSTQDLTTSDNVPQTKVTPTAVFHDGYTSVYTVDRNGDLEEDYLPWMGDGWSTQDLTANYQVPQDINVAPAALYHDGYTSVYYLTGPDDHLVEAYLPAIGDGWGHQDMSANYQTPGSVQTPSPLVHYDTDGGLTWASVYTTDATTGDLEETYLPDAGFPGDSWVNQDLSDSGGTLPGTPPVEPPGSVLYSATSSTEGLGYDRVIRLAQAGAESGDLLGVFEDSNNDGSTTSYHIQRSTDDGATWSTLSTVPADVDAYAPFLYEFPQAAGGLPAGTLMLLGTTFDAGSTNIAIREWYSFDHGATWVYWGVVQQGGSLGGGVYEPFVTLDSYGNLVMLFSDERQNSTYSQFIGEIVSLDGGHTWSANPNGSTNFAPGEIYAVASPWQADRPGMPTVAQLGSGGSYVMSYEMCGPHNCAVYTKTSPNGDGWGSGPSDFGTQAETSDGLYLQESPVITWVNDGTANGTVYLTAHNEVNSNGPIPEGQTAILTSTDGGGSWSWIPAPPIPSVTANPNCHINYSPDLLLTGDHSGLLYTTPAATGPEACQEVTDTIPIAP